jgi:hypothetical protein
VRPEYALHIVTSGGGDAEKYECAEGHPGAVQVTETLANQYPAWSRFLMSAEYDKYRSDEHAKAMFKAGHTNTPNLQAPKNVVKTTERYTDVRCSGGDGVYIITAYDNLEKAPFRRSMVSEIDTFNMVDLMNKCVISSYSKDVGQ